MYVKGKRIPSESRSLYMSREKTSVKGSATLFEGTGIHHSNSGLQITHNMSINGIFVIVYDLTPDWQRRKVTCHPLQAAISGSI